MRKKNAKKKLKSMWNYGLDACCRGAERHFVNRLKMDGEGKSSNGLRASCYSHVLVVLSRVVALM
jgi:hypothetical protein